MARIAIATGNKTTNHRTARSVVTQYDVNSKEWQDRITNLNRDLDRKNDGSISRLPNGNTPMVVPGYRTRSISSF